MKRSYLAATLIAVSLYSSVFANPTTIQEGKRLPVISATAASGQWLERAAFDAASYGKVRGVSPATSSEPKIVLYTSTLSEDFFKIALAVDKTVAKHPELTWSFVQVKDTKGAQYGGYTATELQNRLDEIKTSAKKHGIKHLSFLVSAPGSGTTTPQTTVVIAYARSAEKPNASAVVSWVTEMPAESLQGATLTSQLTALETKINAAP